MIILRTRLQLAVMYLNTIKKIDKSIIRLINSGKVYNFLRSPYNLQQSIQFVQETNKLIANLYTFNIFL